MHSRASATMLNELSAGSLYCLFHALPSRTTRASAAPGPAVGKHQLDVTLGIAGVPAVGRQVGDPQAGSVPAVHCHHDVDVGFGAAKQRGAHAHSDAPLHVVDSGPGPDLPDRGTPEIVELGDDLVRCVAVTVGTQGRVLSPVQDHPAISVLDRSLTTPMATDPDA